MRIYATGFFYGRLTTVEVTNITLDVIIETSELTELDFYFEGM